MQVVHDVDCMVSVVMPAYNREQYIQQAIESVLQQSHRPLELLVVNDGSTDATAEIVQAFGKDVQLVNRANGGAAAARNVGVRLAKGAFLAFLDSDDLWPKDKLEVQLRYLKEHADAGYVLGKVEYFHDPGAQFPQEGLRHDLFHEPRFAQLLQAMVIRRQVFEEVGLFDEHLRTAEDVDWFSRANDMHVKRGEVEDVVARIRIHQDNTSHYCRQNNMNLLSVLRRSVARKQQSNSCSGALK